MEFKKKGFRTWKSGKTWLFSGAGLIAVAIAGANSVSADEVSVTTTPNTSGTPTTVADSSTVNTTVEKSTETTQAPQAEAPKVEAPQAPAVEPYGVVSEAGISNGTPTDNPATNLEQASAGRDEAGKALDAKAGQSEGSVDAKVDHTELQNAVSDAKSTGVQVTETKEEVTTTGAEATSKAVQAAQEFEKKQAQEVKTATDAYKKQLDDWSKSSNDTTIGNAEVGKAYNDANDAYNKLEASVKKSQADVLAKYKDAIISVTDKMITSGDGKSVQGYLDYIKGLAEVQKLNDQSVQNYLSAKEAYDKGTSDVAEVSKRNEANSKSISAHNAEQIKSASEENARRSKAVADGNTSDEARSKSVEAYNKAQEESASRENARRSQSVADDFKAKEAARSKSVDDYNKSQAESASKENERRSNAAKNGGKQSEDARSKSVDDYNKAQEASASKENARRSQSVADKFKADEVARSKSVDDYNKSQAASASEENAKRSKAAGALSPEDAKASKSVADYNASASKSVADKNAEASKAHSIYMANRTSIIEENKSLSLSISKENDLAVIRARIMNEALQNEYRIKKANQPAFPENRSDRLPDRGDGYTPSGSFTHLSNLIVDNKYEIATAGGNGVGTTAYIRRLDGKPLTQEEKSRIVTNVEWKDQEIYIAQGSDNPPITEEWQNIYDYASDGSTKKYRLRKRDVYRIPGAVTTADGKKHDLLFQADIYAKGLASDGSTYMVWNSRNGAINSLDGIPSAAGSEDAIRMIYWVDDTSQSKKYFWVTTMYDIDGGQRVTYDHGSRGMLAVGGGMSTQSNNPDKVASDEELGFSYGVNKHPLNALDGQKSAPDGTVISAVYHEYFTSIVSNSPGGHGSLVARADFGQSGTPKVAFDVTPPEPVEPELKKYTPKEVPQEKDFKPEEFTPKTFTPTKSEYKPVTPKTEKFTPGTPEKYEPVKPNVEKYVPGQSQAGYNPVKPDEKKFTPGTPDTFTPVEPKHETYKPGQPGTYNPVTPNLLDFKPETPGKQGEAPKLQLVNVNKPVTPAPGTPGVKPEAPKVNVKYQDVRYKVTVEKTVKNSDNVDVNGLSVAKGSGNYFDLNVQKLPANRTNVSNILWEDKIQDGLDIDVAKINSYNKGYQANFDSATRTLTIESTKGSLAEVNKDTSKEYEIKAPRVFFTPTNDGAVYENTFKLTIKGGVEKSGKVVVDYFVEGDPKRTPLVPQVTDVEDGKVGSNYSTEDNRHETITKGGKRYERVPNHVEGNENGKVVEGTTKVAYFYKEVKTSGDVIVHYEDESGRRIAKDKEDTRNGKVGNNYNTSKHKVPNIPNGGIEYTLIPNRVIGNEKGKITDGVTEVTYIYKRVTPAPEPKGGITVHSNKVKIFTPGGKENPNDPSNPNGKNNHKIQPVKNNTNGQGKNINGKEMLQGAVNHYVAEWDLDQYNNDKSPKSAIQKGFGYFDVPDQKGLGDLGKWSAVTGKGEAVKGLKFYDVKDLTKADKALQELVSKSGLEGKLSGKRFYGWLAENPQEFYDTYVKTGTDIFFNLPMPVKKGFSGNYENQTFQVDFGNGYYSNIVKNHVPNLVPKKDIIVDGKSADGATIAKGQKFQYLLQGVVSPGNRGEKITQYDIKDDYDQTGDKYLDKFVVKASTDFNTNKVVELKEDTTFDKEVTLEDGTKVQAGVSVKKGSKVLAATMFKKGDDLSKFVTVSHDSKEGIVNLKFNKDFLESITDESPFGADATLEFERIASGEFKNTQITILNGGEYVSNTVKSKTPDPEPEKPQTPENPKTPDPKTPENPTPVPPAPEAPKPVEPAKAAPAPATPVTPVAPQEVLPSTGEASSLLSLAGALLGGIGAFGITKRRKKG